MYVSILQGSVKLIPSLRTIYPDFPKYNFSYHLHANTLIRTFDVSVRLLSAIAVSEICTNVPHTSSYGKVTCMYVCTYVLYSTYMLTLGAPLLSLSCCLHLAHTLHTPPYGTTYVASSIYPSPSVFYPFFSHARISLLHPLIPVPSLRWNQVRPLRLALPTAQWGTS